jgi:hypothetical protein
MASSSDVSVAGALREGARRVNGAWVVLAGLVVVTLLVALPLSLVLRGLIAAQLGTSAVADRVAAGVDYGWWQEFEAQATGLATTFVPSIIGFGAVLQNLGALLDRAPVAGPIAAAIGAWLVVWTFLSGGVIDRLARNRPTRASGFFAACGVHFWRLLRLGIVALAGYALLFGGLHPILFDDLYPRLTADVTVERTAFLVRTALYVVFGGVLILLNLVVDYARIRLVVEDRRSALGAIAASVRFVLRRPGTIGLYLLNGVLFAGLAALYALADPGAPGSGIRLWLTLGLGELYIVARQYLKLLFYASETAYFQGALSGAAWTVAPALVWPESPVAQTIVHSDDAGW